MIENIIAYNDPNSIVDPDPEPDPDPKGSKPIFRIRIRIRIIASDPDANSMWQNLSFRALKVKFCLSLQKC